MHLTFLMSFHSVLNIISTTNIETVFASQTIYIIHNFFFPPSLVFCGPRHAEAELLRGEGGDGGIRTHEALSNLTP